MRYKNIRLIILIGLVVLAGVSFPTRTTSGTCSDCVTTFSDGNSSEMVEFPAGGGSLPFGYIDLPEGAQVCSARLTLGQTSGTGVNIGTPYIWVPLSGSNRLVQIKTDDGSFVAMYGEEGGGITCSAGTYCIWDCTANCNTNSPTWTERGEDTDCKFDNPSRVTVFPGADVWVANRDSGSVTRLGTTTAGYECKATYSGFKNLSSNGGGVTYDATGTIWYGPDHSSDQICRFKKKPAGGCGSETETPDGKFCYICGTTGGSGVYGMIGDSRGNVWISDRSGNGVYRCSESSGAINCSFISGSDKGSLYGIGIDNEGDIWFASMGNGKVYEIDHNNPTSIKTCSNVGLSNGPRGVAVDGNNNVWVANSSDDKIYVVDQDCNSVASTTTGYTNVIGVAIDADNNGWVVSHGSGHVLKYKLQGGTLKKLLDIDVGDHPYNYSDMTGFRTVALNLTIGDYSAPISYVPQDISGISLTTSLNNILKPTNFCSCSGCITTGEDICGNSICEIPTSLSSVFAGGNYSLSGLQICYTPGQSKIKGGLVPCGRKCDDPDTAIDESAACTVCHFFVLGKRVIDFIFKFVVSPLLLLMIVISGAKFVGSAGNPEKIEEAKRILLAAVIGFLVILLTWLTINVFLSFLVKGRLVGPSDVVKILGQPWDRIECPVKTNP